MAKPRRQPRSTAPAARAGSPRAAGHRAKIWLATISTVVGVATGMFTLRDQVFPSEAGSAGAMSTSAYEEHVGRICDEVNANDHLRAHEDANLRRRLPRAQTTIDQRNVLLDAVRRTIAHDGHALAAFNGLEPPKALAPVRRDTQLAWNRNLARVRDYALRLDRAGTRPALLAAIDHLSTLRPLLAADGVRFASGLRRLGGAECDLRPAAVTATITLPALHGDGPLDPAAANTPGQRESSAPPAAARNPGAGRPRARTGVRVVPRRAPAPAPRSGAGDRGPRKSAAENRHTGPGRQIWSSPRRFRVNTPGSGAAIRG
jgi:hypothetical protein